MIALILLLAFPAVYSQTAGPATTACAAGSYSITCSVGFYCATYYTNVNIGAGGTYTPNSANMLPNEGLASSGAIANTAPAYYTTTAYPICLPLKAPGATCTAPSQCGALFQTPQTAPAQTGPFVLTGGTSYGYTAGSGGTLASYITTCSNYRCCKSATCTSGCDSNGNCLGDTTSCAAAVSTTVASKGEQGATGALNTCTVTYFSAVATPAGTNSGLKSINAGGAWTTDAILCAANFYGTPVAISTPVATIGVTTGCLPCPSGSKTQFAGATSISQCYCPADYYLDLSNAMGGGPSITSSSVGSTVSSILTTTTYATTTYAGTLDFAKCTACPTGSNSLAFPVTTSVTTAGISACTYSAKAYANDLLILAKLTEQYAMQTTQYALQQTQYALANNSFVLQTAQYVMQTAQFALANTAFALQTSDFYLNGNWSSTQNAFNTVFRESNNGQLGTQSSIFAFVVIIVLILVFMQFFDIVMRVLTCKCIARSPKSPVTPAPSVTVTAQA